jgi:predicted CopG family antitoxin
MAGKTLSISEEVYNALYRAKGKNESLTEAILRLAGRGAKGSLLEYIRSTPPTAGLPKASRKS